MGFAIVAAISIAGMVGYAIGIVIGRRSTGRVDSRRQVRRCVKLCREAEQILADLNSPPADLTGEFSILTTPTRKRVTEWRNNYRKVNP